MEKTVFATIKDVAEKSGFSCSTVSRALSGNPVISPETARRIKETALKLGYIPNAQARSMASGTTDIICLCLPEYGRYPFSLIAETIIKKASEKGILVLTGIPEDASVLISHLPGGCIFWEKPCGSLTPPVPSAIIKSREQYPGFINITFDEDEALSGLFLDLYKKGRRSFMFPGLRNGNAVYEKRFKLLGSLCGNNGCTLGSIPSNFHGDTFKEGLMTGRIYFAGHVTHEAFICPDDGFALGFIKAAEERGLKTPDDIDIAGFGGIYNGTASPKTLNTVRIPYEEMAEKALDAIL